MERGEEGRGLTVETLEPHGFCMGVKSAIDKALHALSASRPVYCLHELVHNESVVADLKARGLRFIEDLAEISEEGAIVLFSAHGVSPSVRRMAADLKLNAIDATCPFVARIHRQVRSYAEQGMPVVVIGHAEHVEVRGIAGEARDAGARVEVVATAAEVDGLPFPQGMEIGVVSQTTLSSDAVDSVVAALRARYGEVKTTPASEACTATRERQRAVREFVARGGDGVLVLGSAKSSNTRRLAEMAEAGGGRAWRVATLDELAACDFQGVSVLGITSGASTPEPFFSQVLHHLSKRFGASTEHPSSVVY